MGKSRTPLLEWIAAGIGLLLLAAMLAVIGHKALTGDAGGPPAIEVVAGAVSAMPGGFVVEVEARNLSAGTAADVEVEGTLNDGDTELEASSLTFEYLPGHAARRGGLMFARDPRAHSLELRALGYQEP